MSVNKREKTLLIVTLTLVSIWLVYSLWAQDIIDQYTSVSSSLDKAQQDYAEAADTIVNSLDLIKEYQEMVQFFPEKIGNQRPEAVFSEEIARLCREMGFYTPNLSPAKREPIENVVDFEFVTLIVKLSGDWSVIAKTLKAFQQRSFIVKTIRVQNKRNSLEVDTEIEVARLVKSKIAERRERKSRIPSRSRRRLTF